MDPSQFDSLSRSLASAKSRRGFLGSLAALGAALVGVRGSKQAGAQVSQASCGNVVCYDRRTQTQTVACAPGCVCCVYPNGNSRCRPPGTCAPGIEFGGTTTTTPAPTSTTTTTATTSTSTTTATTSTTTTATTTTQAPTSTTTTTQAPTSTTTTTACPTTICGTTCCPPELSQCNGTTCVQCLTGVDCPGGTPYCINNACLPCVPRGIPNSCTSSADCCIGDVCMSGTCQQQ